MWWRLYLSLGIKGECNEQYNEAGTSQRNMQTGDERSGFQSEPLGVSWLRKGERVRRGRADRRGERGWAGGSILGLCMPEFLYPPNISAPLPAVPPACPKHSPAEWVLFWQLACFCLWLAATCIHTTVHQFEKNNLQRPTGIHVGMVDKWVHYPEVNTLFQSRCVS